MSDNTPCVSRNEVRRRRWRSCHLNNKYFAHIDQKRLRLIRKMERRAKLLNEGNIYFKKANNALKSMVKIMGRGSGNDGSERESLRACSGGGPSKYNYLNIDRIRLYEVLRLLTGDVIQAIEMTSKMARTLTTIYNFLQANQAVFYKGGPRRCVQSIQTNVDMTSNTEKSYLEGAGSEEHIQSSEGSAQKQLVSTNSEGQDSNSKNQITFEQQGNVGRKCLTVNPMVEGHVISRAYVVLERLQLPLGDYSVPVNRLQLSGGSDTAIQQKEESKKPVILKPGLDKEIKLNLDKGKAKLRFQPRFSTRNMSSPNKGFNRKAPIAIARPFRSDETEASISSDRPVENMAVEYGETSNQPGPSWAFDSTSSGLNDN